MNKAAVADHFSQAAATYDAAAHLQRTVADRLMALLKHAPLSNVQQLVDLGTGTGYCLPTMIECFQPAETWALDISQAMLEQAEHRVPAAKTQVMDLDNLNWPESSIDVAVSSLAVQWLDDPAHFLSQLAKALKPGGVAGIATLGPVTLWELKAAWAQVDTGKHVNDFHPAVTWIEAAEAAGLQLDLWREERLQVRYEQPMQLLAELKALGAHYVERDKPRSLGSVRKMLRAYEAFTRQGQYPATWDVHYLMVSKR